MGSLRRKWPTHAIGYACIGWVLGVANCSRNTPDLGGSATNSVATSSIPVLAVPSALREIGVELPQVGLDGTSHPLGITRIEKGGARVYSVALRAWIYSEPNKTATRLGYLRAGGSAPRLEAGPDVEGWVRIAPRGYIRLDDDATSDPGHPVVAVFGERPPDFERKLPYIYGTVRNPGPIYGAIPDAAVLREAEPDLSERMPKWLNAAGEVGAKYAPEVWTRDLPPEDPASAWQEQRSHGVPEFLADGRALPVFGASNLPVSGVVGHMRPKTGYAFLETFFAGGRRYGVTTSLKLVPTDRFRPIRGSDFHGFEIGKDVHFPFAIVRSPVAKFKDGSPAEYRAALALSGKQQFFDGILYYETADSRWINDRFASRVEPAKKMPRWGKQGEKWIDINITKQVLVLYEGEKPVFATLVSSGEAGLESHESTTATKRGIFRIHTKHVTSTMSSSEVGEEFELQDVPYVQYFDKDGFALHAAYWHDRFGIPKSHGCVNLSPEDARRIFFWTEPQLPAGWHGVLSPLNGTVVFVHP